MKSINKFQLLHRQIQNITLSVFESDPVMSRRLSSLSLWATLQALGRENISEKIALSFETCRIMYEIISKHDGIKLLVNKNFKQIKKKCNKIL